MQSLPPNLSQTFDLLRKRRQLLKEESAERRCEKLRGLLDSLLRHREKIYQALETDLRRPPQEAELGEIYPLLSECRYTLKHLKQWMKPVSVANPLYFFGSKSEIVFEPLGISLIIGPWNYPFLLTLHPLISAVAAGNCAIVKPSELTPASSSVINEVVKDSLSSEEVVCVEGGVDLSQYLLTLPFDHIFFTGSTQIGRIVMEAAAKHLSRVTLELGGKSPVIVDASTDLKDAAEKIAWGKLLNAGQTCVAPDYALVAEPILPEFLNQLKNQIEKNYQNRFQKESDLCKIVSRSHFNRIKRLIDLTVQQGARLELGGLFFDEEQVITPTLLSQVTGDHPIMSEEIFGPVLPILTYSDLDQALEFIRNRPKPLALYLFSQDPSIKERVIKGTSAGSTCINNVVAHLGHHGLPFGGVGASGQGAYHGRFGFREFSHERAVMQAPSFLNAMKIIYPPYRPKLLKWLQKL